MKGDGAMVDPWMFIEPGALEILMSRAEALIKADSFVVGRNVSAAKPEKVPNADEILPVPDALTGMPGTRSTDAPLVSMHGDGVAVLDIRGPMMRSGGGLLAWLLGGTSYDRIAKDFVAAMGNPAVRAVVLSFDSPGGVVKGNHELANMIWRRRGEKPVVAYVDGMCASAAYWLASAADEIVADGVALVGSIGTVANAYPKSKYLIEVVSKNAPKKRLDPETDAGRAEIQMIVDDLEAKFIAGVARNRGETEDTIKKRYGQGGLFVAERALGAGMVDRLGSLDDLIEELSTGAAGASSTIESKTEGLTMDYETLKAEHPGVFEKVRQEGRAAGLADGRSDGHDEGVKAERERVLEIMGAGADGDATREAIEKGTPAAAAYKAFYESEKAKRAKGLADLAASAAEGAGTSTEEEDLDPDPDGKLPVDQLVSKRAAAMAKEKGIEYGAAMERVLAEDQVLAKAYAASFQVQE